MHDQIERRMAELKVRPILLLQEQNVGKRLGYQTFQSDIGKTRSRACLLVPDEIRFVHLEDYSSVDTCSGLLKCDGEEDIVVVSAYMDSNHLHIDEHLIKAIEYAKDKGLKCLIGCDSNAWSTVWGSERSNHRESLVLDLLIEYNLTVANVGSTPTFVRTNAESIIDLTIGSNGLNIDEWKVEETDMLSDHRLITFRIDKKPVKSEGKLTRDVRIANWHRFRALLKESLCFSSKHYWTPADLEKESQHVTKCITDALDIVAPLKERESRGKPSIWANPEYRALSNKVKAANRRRRRRPTDHRNVHREMLKLDRKQAGIVIRAISGHSMIKEHLKRTEKLDENATMDSRLCGQAVETNEHLIECPDLRMERVLAFGTSDKEQIQKHWKIANIAEFCRNDKVKSILLAQEEPDN